MAASRASASSRLGAFALGHPPRAGRRLLHHRRDHAVAVQRRWSADREDRADLVGVRTGKAIVSRTSSHAEARLVEARLASWSSASSPGAVGASGVTVLVVDVEGPTPWASSDRIGAERGTSRRAGGPGLPLAEQVLERAGLVRRRGHRLQEHVLR